MAARTLLSSHRSLPSPSPSPSLSLSLSASLPLARPRTTSRRNCHVALLCSASPKPPPLPPLLSLPPIYEQKKNKSFSLKQCGISLALAIGLLTTAPPSFLDSPAHALPLGPALPDISVLISGPPIKDPRALLRYALPINNKAIREVQKPLEDITDSLKVAGVRALDSVERVSSSHFNVPFDFFFSAFKVLANHLSTSILH